MKTLKLRSLTSLALLIALSLANTHCTEYDDSLAPPPPVQYSIISRQEARHIALNHSGVAPKRATFEKVVFNDGKNGGRYKVRFSTPNRIFVYTIRAHDGKVIDVKINNLNKRRR